MFIRLHCGCVTFYPPLGGVSSFILLPQSRGFVLVRFPLSSNLQVGRGGTGREVFDFFFGASRLQAAYLVLYFCSFFPCGTAKGVSTNGRRLESTRCELYMYILNM
ncbi:hypothetical protein, unlikely [Trypanosoma brucei brucei TREU927]|uniref:Uncharacterized protein n=1 Tax=Trypanosoma brucei brucei (strain 927/4 GUTat10.1) TaxID=185431 RepID=Q38F44_TRYB2|nr:hypothetical protein, unlikely [Trypanosoma brucei brucei TREU927]EAN76576.1 hypothetical protein, unlikely [Trypanosoma brucei brucei TREU927]